MQYHILQSVMQNVGAYAAPQDEQLAEIDSPGRALSSGIWHHYTAEARLCRRFGRGYFRAAPGHDPP
jgi:hypothetical protein